MVSILIVTLRADAHLRKCLRSLTAVTDTPFEVVVMNNSGRDSVKKLVTGVFPDAAVITGSEDYGFAQGNTVGYTHCQGEYILLLNDDTIVTQNFLSPLVRELDTNKRVGVVQPKIIFTKTGKLQAGGCFLTSTGFLYHYGSQKNPDDPLYNKKIPIYSANGSCMLIRKTVIEMVGLFDPDFFAYFEESDFCHRVWIAGYKILYVPTACMFHTGSATLVNEKQRIILEYHSYKNRICSYLKNLDTRGLLTIFPLHLLFCQLYALVLLVRRNVPVFRAVQKAFFWNLRHLGSTLKKRKAIQKSAKVPFKSIAPYILKNPRLEYYYALLFRGLLHYTDDSMND